MPTSTIPRSPHDVTEGWLTDALRSIGVLNAGEVSALKTTVMGDGQGFSGQVARIELEYANNNGTAPASLIAKFPPADPQFYEALAKYGIYEREASFYNELSNDICLSVPQLYYSHVEPEKGKSVLLLEDFRDIQPPDLFAGMSLDEALYVLEQLAHFHASWWQSPRLAEFEWLWMFNQRAPQDQEDFIGHFDTFKNTMSDLVPPEFIAMGERVTPNVAWIKDQLSKEPLTLMHGDCHLNNMLLGAGPDGYDLKVFDWQLCCRGNAMRDVVYFIANSVTNDVRKTHESTMLNTYYKTLIKQDVTDFSMEDCLHAYKLSTLDFYWFMVTVLVILDFTVSEDTLALRDLVFERWGGFILDHYPIDLLPDG